MIVADKVVYRNKKKQRQYLVKWKGYPDVYNEWIDLRNLNADLLVQDYWKRKGEQKTLHPATQQAQQPPHMQLRPKRS